MISGLWEIMRGHGPLIEGLNIFLPEGFELQVWKGKVITKADGEDIIDSDDNLENSSDDGTRSRQTHVFIFL